MILDDVRTLSKDGGLSSDERLSSSGLNRGEARLSVTNRDSSITIEGVVSGSHRSLGEEEE